MKQLDALGSSLDKRLSQVEALTTSPLRASLLGVALALAVVIDGLIGLVVILKVLTALF